MDNDVIKVALLTDSSTVDGMITALLDAGRFNIKSLHSGEAYFFQKLIEYKPQLIFIRAMLSNMDGLSLCDRIRSHHNLREARLIFISTDQLNRESAIDHRANDFLQVPFSRSDIESVVAPLLEKKIKLLLVDDSKVSRKLIKPALEMENYDVIEAGNGEEALKLIRSINIDIIVSDVEMPVLDGVTLCRIIRQQEKLSTPILLLSSLNTDKAIMGGFNAGADDYIIKSDHSATHKIVLPE